MNPYTSENVSHLFSTITDFLYKFRCHGNLRGSEYMKNYMPYFEHSDLFRGFSTDEIVSALTCLEGTIHKYQKKDILFMQDKPLTAVGLILQGTVYLTKEDASGAYYIFSELTDGDLFGETALLFEQEYSGYGAYAAEDSQILFIQMQNITNPTGTICSIRGKVIENLLSLIVKNNRLLYHKLDIVSHKSLRQRILHYLELQARRNHSTTFSIPFTRADLADYLTVDRSALSRELRRMEQDGLIKYTKNKFELLEQSNS